MGSYLSTQQLANRLGLAKITLAIWRCEGRGPRYRKLGSRVLYDARDVSEWLDSRTRQSTRENPPAPPRGPSPRTWLSNSPPQPRNANAPEVDSDASRTGRVVPREAATSDLT